MPEHAFASTAWEQSVEDRLEELEKENKQLKRKIEKLERDKVDMGEYDGRLNIVEADIGDLHDAVSIKQNKEV